MSTCLHCDDTGRVDKPWPTDSGPATERPCFLCHHPEFMVWLRGWQNNQLPETTWSERADLA